LGPAASVFAQSQEEMDILQMIYKDKDLVTPTRSPKLVSQVAENVTVINAEEIEAINAHTLSDVLLHVTGVQVDIHGGPGAFTNVLIQGSDTRHVRVMMDGVTINNLSDNFADIGAFPVQQIERIEIIKGPASSAWGSSLGGIINIITKSPDPDRKSGGTVSAAIGERTTADLRAELSGMVGSLGYYIYGGGLTGDGLTPNTPVDTGDLYAKLQWEATRKARLQLSIAYDKGARGDGQFPPADLAFRDSFEYFFSTLSFNYAFSDDLNLDISGRVSTKRNKQFANLLSSGAEQFKSISDELSAGGSAKLAWRKGMQSLLIGADYDSGAMEKAAILDGRQTQVRWALFANDTLSLWKFSLTPGVRYDHTSTNGDFWSPSLGVTFALSDQTTLRAYAARGFSTPPLFFTFGDGFSSLRNSGLKAEEVWSYSVGVETTAARYLWFKATGFIHEISDAIAFSDSTSKYVNQGKQCRQGVEAEMRTVPVWNTSLMAGFAFIDITNRETQHVIKNLPRYTYDLGIDYNDNDTLRGALRGHYIWWNASADANARYTAMIWDLNLAKRFIERDGRALEAFFTAHNIFNGAQYSDGIFPNPRRWFEGGIRFKF
ncbi:MAG TPA: TonB-dependent receptor, partial [Geobacteraceae bacterium]|nr:TonB-dependent receptor [Geobacteraceae bacterium]